MDVCDVYEGAISHLTSTANSGGTLYKTASQKLLLEDNETPGRVYAIDGNTRTDAVFVCERKNGRRYFAVYVEQRRLTPVSFANIYGARPRVRSTDAFDYIWVQRDGLKSRASDYMRYVGLPDQVRVAVEQFAALQLSAFTALPIPASGDPFICYRVCRPDEAFSNGVAPRTQRRIPIDETLGIQDKAHFFGQLVNHIQNGSHDYPFSSATKRLECAMWCRSMGLGLGFRVPRDCE